MSLDHQLDEPETLQVREQQKRKRVFLDDYSRKKARPNAPPALRPNPRDNRHPAPATPEEPAEPQQPASTAFHLTQNCEDVNAEQNIVFFDTEALHLHYIELSREMTKLVRDQKYKEAITRYKPLVNAASMLDADSADFDFKYWLATQYINCAIAYGKIQLYEQAIALAQKARLLHPTWYKTYSTEASILYKDGNHQAWESAFKKGIEVCEGNDRQKLIQKLKAIRDTCARRRMKASGSGGKPGRGNARGRGAPMQREEGTSHSHSAVLLIDRPPPAWAGSDNRQFIAPKIDIKQEIPILPVAASWENKTQKPRDGNRNQEHYNQSSGCFELNVEEQKNSGDDLSWLNQEPEKKKKKKKKKEKQSRYIGIYWDRTAWEVKATNTKTGKMFRHGRFKDDTEAAMALNQKCDELGIPRKNPSVGVGVKKVETNKETKRRLRGNLFQVLSATPRNGFRTRADWIRTEVMSNPNLDKHWVTRGAESIIKLLKNDCTKRRHKRQALVKWDKVNWKFILLQGARDLF